MLEEIDYFNEMKFTQKSIEDMTTPNKISFALLMKRSSDNLTGDIDEVVLQMVYGNSRKPPGDERSPGYKLMMKLLAGNDEEDDNRLYGIWAPPNKYAKAVALKVLFQNLSAPYKFPDYVPTPLYVAVGYDAFKTRDVMEISAKYPGQVMAYGFFTSDIPTEAQLIAKTVEEFEERTTPPTYEEKLVIQLVKSDPACFKAFCELGPTYMSSDVEVGEMDCKYFFPEGYLVREEEVTEVKKKTKKKGKKAAAAHATQEEVTSVATSDLIKEQSELDHEEVTELESDEEKHLEMEEEEVKLGSDKATSPIGDQES